MILQLRYAAIVAALIFSSTSVIASSSGQIGRSTTTSGGCDISCHGSASSLTTVTILEAIDGKILVAPNASIDLTLRVANSTATAAGCNISVRATLNGAVRSGTLSAITGQGLFVAQNELTHTSPKTMTAGSADFTFKWSAPSLTGTYYLHAAGNAVNRNGASTGDRWAFLTPVQLVVSQVDKVYEETKPLSSLRPLPAHDQVTFSSPTVPGTEVFVSIFDVQGTIVRSETRFAESDTFEFVWNTKDNYGINVLPGSYVVAILNNRKVFTGTALVIR